MAIGIERALPHELNAVYDLRWQVLREPLGEAKGSERDEYDERPETIHGIALEGRRIVAAGRIHHRDENPKELQIRYMATHPDFQRRGIGGLVLARMETIARITFPAAEAFVLNARLEAQTLYDKAGYNEVSGVIELHGLPHVQMRKEIEQ